MNLYLCDDEQKIRDELIQQISVYLPEAEITDFSSGKDLLDGLSVEGCDILLLDIDMPGLSGMEVAARLLGLSRKPLLVFVTGHDELVYTRQSRLD